MLADKIKQAACAATKKQAVEVQEWGVTIYLRELSVGEWLDLVRERDSLGDRIVFELVARCAVDEQGGSIWTADEVAQMPAGQLAIIQRLFAEAQRLQIGERDPNG